MSSIRLLRNFASIYFLKKIRTNSGKCDIICQIFILLFYVRLATTGAKVAVKIFERELVMISCRKKERGLFYAVDEQHESGVQVTDS